MTDQITPVLKNFSRNVEKMDFTHNSKTQNYFLSRREFIKAIAGPVGSGKTYACVQDILCRAMMQPPDNYGVRHTKTLIVRATYGNLEKSALASINNFIPSSIGTITRGISYQGKFKFRLGADGSLVVMELVFISAPTGQGIESMKSQEYTMAWLPEGTELDEIIYTYLKSTRIGRFPSPARGAPAKYPGIIMDFNYVGKDHWAYKHFVQDPDVLEDGPENTAYQEKKRMGLLTDTDLAPQTKIFIKQPPAAYCDNLSAVEAGTERPVWRLNLEADNIANLKDGYYAKQLKSNPTYTELSRIKADVLCLWSNPVEGALVFPRFDGRDHLIPESEGGAELNPDFPVLMGLDDSGFNPAAVFGQYINGCLTITSELFCPNTAQDSFLEEDLVQHISVSYPGYKIIAVCDPANQRDKGSGLTTYQKLLKLGMQAGIIRGGNALDRRIAAVNYFIDRRRGFRIDKKCEGLIKGFEGAYVFEKKRAGGFAESPTKGDCSHLQDALQYLCVHCRFSSNSDIKLKIMASRNQRMMRLV